MKKMKKMKNMKNMKILFMQSKDHPDISEFELITVLNKKINNPFDGIAIVKPDKNKTRLNINMISRLAYTNSAYELLFAVKTKDKEELIEKMDRFGWQKYYKKDFSLKITNLTGKKNKFNLPDLADIIWKRLKDPKANLKDPKTVFEIIITDKVYVCRLIWQNPKGYNERKPHMRPMLYPVSLSPKLARACINMAGIDNADPENKTIIMDPFLGTGGFLIEAGIMGFNTEGIDIDKVMIKRTKANLDYYNIKNYIIRKGDALKLNKPYDYIVTDLPYGKNTKSIQYHELYIGFLKTLEKILKKRAVIIFPDFIDYKKMIQKAKGLAIKKEFDYYIHKSMTKKIVVIEKRV
jgi:tRNA (guanine10-N2)-dimethyltransferase